MKFILILSSLLVITFSGSVRKERGTCVEECNLTGEPDIEECPEGYQCKSNGCGHVCKPILSAEKRQVLACPAIGCLNECANGYVIGANGCPTCRCIAD